jgi:hypothetical protein
MWAGFTWLLKGAINGFFVKKVMELRITQKVGNSLTSQATISFTMRIRHTEVGGEAVTDIFIYSFPSTQAVANEIRFIQ